MCTGGGSPNVGSPLPPVAPPPPPPQIVVAGPPTLAMMPELQNAQARPDNPVRKRRGTKRRGKSMLKVPLNTSGGGLNA
jgi:hypothetical protein